MSNKKQTAVQWLVKELNQKIDFIPLEKWDMIRDIIQQAKEMEKEQKINFAYDYINSGAIGCLWDGDSAPELDIDTDPKQFYEQTYGGDK
jgi:hypothetical protein